MLVGLQVADARACWSWCRHCRTHSVGANRPGDAVDVAAIWAHLGPGNCFDKLPTKAGFVVLNPSIDKQVEHAKRVFYDQFGRPPTDASLAPGRVNLIGEHIDYNDGFVLPMAIERQVVMVGSPNGSDEIRLWSEQFNEGVYGSAVQSIENDQIDSYFSSRPAWSRYPLGVIEEARRESLNIPGFDAVVTSSVPLGGGLSSSAALEVSTCTLLEEMLSERLDNRQRALLCQRAEHRFAGVPCGLMDQFSCVFAESEHLMLIDCLQQSVQQVRFDRSDLAVLIVNSNVRHALDDGGYQTRREQCRKALQLLGKDSFRGVSLIETAKLQNGYPLLFRRARHVVTEIQRTRDMAGWLEEGNLDLSGQAMYQSHESLRGDYEVSCHELDVLVEIASDVGLAGGVYGSRMTGGGFGGCTVNLVDSTSVPEITQQIISEYRRRTGQSASCFATRPAAGAKGWSFS